MRIIAYRSGLLFLFALGCFAERSLSSEQLPGSTNWNCFLARDYATYLTHLTTELSGPPDELKQKFPQLVAVAISLEKTKGWETEGRGQKAEGRKQESAGQEARELLAKSPEALRWLEALRLLLQEDTKGLSRFFDGDPPNYSQWQGAIPVLREHGFELAANCFETVYLTGTIGIGGWQDPKAVEQGIVAWVSIPKDKRGPVDEFMLSRLDKDWNRASQVAQAAMNLFQTQSHQGAKAQGDILVTGHDLYELALRVGKDVGIVSFDNATRLQQSGKNEEAKMMLRALAKRNPTDPHIQNQAANFLAHGFAHSAGDRDEAREVYEKALRTVPEPMTRDVRLEYLKFLKAGGNPDALAKIEKGKDSLLVADALLLDGKFPEAATLFQKETRNPKSDIRNRLAAWSGLLDADPASALKDGADLFEAFRTDQGKGNHNSAIRNRQSEISWLGWQLWRAVEGEIPLPEGTYSSPSREYAKPLNDVPDWERQTAALMDRLLEIDPVACLRYDHSAGSISLRFPAAEMFAQAGQGEQAMEILKRPVKYQVDPPPGGWRNPPGIPSPPDANQPRTFTSPSEGDLQKLPLELLRTMSRVKAAATIVPQLSRAFCSDLVSRIQTSKKPEDLQRCVKQLAGALAITVKAIDPLPTNLSFNQPLPQREVNTEAVAPVGAAFREALKSNEVAKTADLLISEGIQPSMLQATNAKLLDLLFDLATFTLDRFKEVAGAQAAWATASNFANSLEARLVCPLKPYAQRLRERYPKP